MDNKDMDFNKESIHLLKITFIYDVLITLLYLAGIFLSDNKHHNDFMTYLVYLLATMSIIVYVIAGIPMLIIYRKEINNFMLKRNLYKISLFLLAIFLLIYGFFF